MMGPQHPHPQRREIAKGSKVTPPDWGSGRDFPARALEEPGWDDDDAPPSRGGESSRLRSKNAVAEVVVRVPMPRIFYYAKMVQGWSGSKRPRTGDLVAIVDRDGQRIGVGIWNEHSEIRLRLLHYGTGFHPAQFWAERIQQAVDLRRTTLSLDTVTNAYRVIHAEGDGLSGLVVDRFDDTLSVEPFSYGMYQRIGPLLGLLHEALGTRHARVKVDPWIAQAEGMTLRPDDLVLASPGLPPRVTIHEHGVRYRIRLEGSHKTGFFCDQRQQRSDLAQYCQGRSVLDVCSYTGGFALNAALRGQARDVTAIDLDEYAIGVAKENGNLNQARIHWVQADAFVYLRQMAEQNREYGVVVLDPPKLINSREEVSQGKRKYFDLNVLAFRRVTRNGILLTCSCSGLLSLDEFVMLIRAAARHAGRTARILGVAGAGPDHPVRLDALEGAYLKALWVQVGDSIAPQSQDSGQDSSED